MASISSAGIGSGLDVNSIVTQLMAIERQPIDQLKTQEKSLQTQLSSYGKVQSTLSALKDAAAELAKADTWSPTTATTSDPSAVSAAAGALTPPGSYKVEVTRLAAAQTAVTTAVFADAAAVVGQGTLHIELGTWNADATAFTPKGAAIDVPVGAGADTLAGVRDSINAANAGVFASVVTDANGARLVLRSTQTGADNGFRIGVSDADGNDVDNAGLSALAFDPAAGAASMTRAQSASNAEATINGVSIVAGTNQLADIVDGLSLTLSKTTATPVEVGVVRDDEAIRQSVDAFVTAYNDVVKLLKEQTRYDATTKTAAPLSGDGTAVSLLTTLRTMVGAVSGASSVFPRLSSVGLEIQTDSSLKVNTAKLDAALAQASELAKAFTNLDASNADNNGFGVRFKAWTTTLLGLDGALQTRKTALQERIDRNEDRQAALERRMTMIEQRMRAQYTSLDAAMGRLQGLSNYVTQQIAALNRNSGT